MTKIYRQTRSPLASLSLVLTLALVLSVLAGSVPPPVQATGNMLTNGDFETGAISPWTTPQNGGSAAINSDPAYVHTGSYSGKIATSPSSTGASGVSGGGNCSGGNRLAVAASTTYTWSAWILVPAATPNFTSARVRVAWYAACTGGSSISTTDSATVIAASGTWARVEGIATSPATAKFAELRLFGATSPAKSVSIYFDDVYFDVYSGAPVLPIGTVNGPVGDTDNGATHNAAYLNQVVTVQGVIYEKTRQPNGHYGFFIQNTATTADSDPNTSDGLYVYMSSASTMSAPGGTTYTPVVGDEVILAGLVTEYYNMTELMNPVLVAPVVRSGVALDTEVPAFVANPPVSLADANRYWERRQGMRAQVPLNSIVLGGRNVYSPPDGEVWIAHPQSTIALRSDPYARRAFRDAHLLDDNYDANNWDGNGYRILMGSWGVKTAAGGDVNTLIAPLRTFDTVTNAPVGGINYSYSKYRIEVTTQPTFSAGPDPAANNPPPAFDRDFGYSIADYNVENLFDYRDNPFSSCDFPGNPGCSIVAPFLAPITSPYTYVPADEAAYQAHLTEIANQIITDLHSPDILMVQEVENQDICTVTGLALTCGTTDNADAKPDTLQELALKIASLGGPAYDAAFDRNSSDLRGILPAFLYRTDRVQLLPPAGDPILGSSPEIVYAGAAVPSNNDVSNPKTLNAVLPASIAACETSWVFPRAPAIALFRIYRWGLGVGGYRDVYVINNHFKSGPDTCVAHRTEQARYNAAIVQYIQAANPQARIVLGGDLNVFPRPDDPFAPIGQPTSSDQLGSLYAPSLWLKNLWEVLLDQAPASAYSYVYVGMTQTLDQMFVNQTMLADLWHFRIAHINSDFPADYGDDGARGASDHDPNVAIFRLLEAPIRRLPVP